MKINVKSFFKNKESLLLGLILLSFILFSSYLALNINPGIAPDELYHIPISQAYSKVPFIPENSSETYQYSDITRIPYLSYWINGRLLNLNVTRITGLTDLVVMRAINIFYSTLTILVTFLISKLIINKRYYNLIPSFLLSNTLMFAFLSSAVSYDNLANLFSVLSIYFLIKYIKGLGNQNILFVIISLCLGVLSKLTIMPLAFIEVLILMFIFIKNRNLNKVLKEFVTKYKYYLIPTITSLLLCFALFGINLIHYKGLTVSCNKILTHEQCMTNLIYSRGETLESTEISNLHEFYNLMDSRLTPVEYISAWSVAMGERTFGIMGHQNLFMPKIFVNIYIFILTINSLLIIRFWEKRHKAETSLILIFLFYTLLLLFYQNYKTYLQRNIFVLALQGRYIFPVLSIFYTLQIKYLLRIKNRTVRYFWISVILLVFALGCIPFLWKHLPESWLIN